MKQGNKPIGIQEAINVHKSTHAYELAKKAQAYAATNNTEIATKSGYLQRKYPQLNKKIKFHKISNGDFGRAMGRHTIYSLGNGAQISQEIKEKIDRKLDIKLMEYGEKAKIDGVVWVFPDLDDNGNPILNFYRIVEGDGAEGFLVMLDERTGKQRAAIRYWRLSEDKPMYATLFEVDGITEYKKLKGGTFFEDEAQRPYEIDVIKYPNGTFPNEISNVRNHGTLPIFPLKSNPDSASEFTNEIEGLIDALDFVTSAICDDVTLVEGIYWILQNYGGQDSDEIKEIVELSKTIESFDGVAGAKGQALESPFQAKQFLMEWLTNRLNRALMLPDAQTTRGVTATEIKDNRDPMDIEASSFEPQVIELLEEILALKGIDEAVQQFKRRTMVNDTETINNISLQLAGESWSDIEEAINSDPTIPEDRKKALIERKKLELAIMDDEKFGLEGDEDTEVTSDEVTQEVEQVAGKGLTGIQTTSLIGVIEKYAAGSLTLQQAINIASVSIGVTQEEARRIIEGLK